MDKNTFTAIGCIGIILFYSLMLAWPFTGNPYDAVGIIEISQKSDPENFVSHGSGVFISPTKFLTAQHVSAPWLNADNMGQVRTENGTKYRITDVTNSGTYDLAYVTVDHPYKGIIPQLSCDPQTKGTELTTIGNPLSIEFIESTLRSVGGRVRSDIVDSVPGQPEPLMNPPPVDVVGTIVTPKIEGAKKLKQLEPGDINPQTKPDGPSPQGEQATNLKGNVFFQGIALPGQSGSPVFDDDKNLVGIIAISIVEQNITSFTGLGMYVSTENACDFIRDSV